MTTRRMWLVGLFIIIGGIIIYTNYRQNNHNLPNGKMTNDTSSISFPNLDSTTPAPITGRPQVQLNTSKGTIILELRPDVAPKTVANFLQKWNSGECNGLTFHRVEDWVVQGCDPKGNGTGGKDSLPTETSSETFSTGSLGVARKAYPKDISNDSQIFIVKKDSSFLDGDYTYFGRVISGMDIVNSLSIGDKFISTNLLTK